VDIHATEEGVETIVEDRGKYNDTQGIEVANDIVGHSISSQHGRQEACRVSNAIVVDILNRKEAKYTGCLEGTANILDELVVPSGMDVQAASGNNRWLSTLPESMPSYFPDAAVT
jgi:hypothetical protein